MIQSKTPKVAECGFRTARTYLPQSKTKRSLTQFNLFLANMQDSALNPLKNLTPRKYDATLKQDGNRGDKGSTHVIYKYQ